MKYVDKNLRINEHVVAKAKVSWTVMAVVILRVLFFMLVGLAVWNSLKDPSLANTNGTIDLNLNLGDLNPFRSEQTTQQTPQTGLIVHNYGDQPGPVDIPQLNPQYSTPMTAPSGTVSLNVKLPDPTAFLIIWSALTVIYIVYKALSISAVELVVTEKKIVGKTGIIWTKSVDAFLEKIDYFMIRETLAGRIFNYSEIEIGTTSSKVKFPYIEYASYFKNTVMDCIDRKKYNDMTVQAKLISDGLRERQPGQQMMSRPTE